MSSASDWRAVFQWQVAEQLSGAQWWSQHPAAEEGTLLPEADLQDEHTLIGVALLWGEGGNKGT